MELGFTKIDHSVRGLIKIKKVDKLGADGG